MVADVYNRHVKTVEVNFKLIFRVMLDNLGKE